MENMVYSLLYSFPHYWKHKGDNGPLQCTSPPPLSSLQLPASRIQWAPMWLSRVKCKRHNSVGWKGCIAFDFLKNYLSQATEIYIGHFHRQTIEISHQAEILSLSLISGCAPLYKGMKWSTTCLVEVVLEWVFYRLPCKRCSAMCIPPLYCRSKCCTACSVFQGKGVLYNRVHWFLTFFYNAWSLVVLIFVYESPKYKKCQEFCFNQ